MLVAVRPEVQQQLLFWGDRTLADATDDRASSSLTCQMMTLLQMISFQAGVLA